MPYVVTGMRGGVGEKVGTRDPAFWSKLVDSDCSDIAGRREPSHSPRTLTVVVNNHCNLACRHCYLQIEQLEDRELSFEEWEKVAYSVAGRSLSEAVAIAGKEVFFGDRGIRILQIFSEAFEGGLNGPRLGLICNGTLVHRHLDRLLPLELDYLDVSVDGDQPEHDAIRGKGAFVAMVRNIPVLKERFGDNLFANLTLQKLNLPTLERAFRRLSALGFSTIGIGFYHPLAYTDASLTLEPGDYELFFDTLRRLASAQLDRPLTLLSELDLANFRAQQAFLRSGWFDPATTFEDARGDLVQELDFPNGLKLQFRLDFWPSLVSNSTRLTPEGLYLSGDDTLNTRLYPLVALGNVRDANCDVLELHASACEHQRIDAIWADYRHQRWPQIRSSLLESGAIPINSLAPRLIPAKTDRT